MKQVKNMFWKHWNCIPWLLCGICVVADGEVMMYQYIFCLISLLIIIWIKLPLNIDTENGHKNINIDNENGYKNINIDNENGYKNNHMQK